MLWLVLCFSVVAAQPNIILVLTDDQDASSTVLGMQKTNNLARSYGVFFDNAFATTPVCCPSRFSLLTGLYQHNHLVRNNSISGGCNDHEFSKISMGTIMQRAGYKTFYAGKYYNQFMNEKRKGLPIGWDHFAMLKGNSVYYNYTLFSPDGGKFYGNKSEDYLTDVLSSMATDFIRNTSEKQPFFMIIATPAPHQPFTPSEKYKDRLKMLTALRTPNFNTATFNKHWLIRSNSFLDASAVKLVDEVFHKRIETLLSVDDLVESVYSSAPKDTYIFITSDHGFHMGQFSQAWDKRQPYESDIRVPMIVLGPKLPVGAHIPNPVLLIDLPATFYEIAKVHDVPKMDGQSFYPLLRKSLPNPGRKFFIDYEGEGGSGDPCYEDKDVKLCSSDYNCNCFDARNNTFSCIRSLFPGKNTLHCKFKDDEGFVEVYDLNQDPYQLNNLAYNTSVENKLIIQKEHV